MTEDERARGHLIAIAEWLESLGEIGEICSPSDPEFKLWAAHIARDFRRLLAQSPPTSTSGNAD